MHPFFSSPFQAFKLWLVAHLNLAKDALHVYVALVLLFGSALLFGWRLSSWRPWLVVLAAALAGEAWDVRDSIAYHIRIDVNGHLHDIGNTLFWPTMILLLARATTLFAREAGPAVR